MAENEHRDVPIIYNLFPSLVGEVQKWRPHVQRARDMEFNWVFLNPIHLTGASGSLYSIRDYFKLSPMFFPQESAEAQFAAFRRFVETSRSAGVEVMVDLVINHTAYDNPLTRDHRNWYKSNPDGSIKNPGAVDNNAPDGYVTWGDLNEIDNENSSDKHNLHEYWWRLLEMFLELGVRGYRCDAAYQVPSDLWQMLIRRAKEKDDRCVFFAESLGCAMEDTIRLANDGFDFVFNSGKWWNYREDWFLGQLQEMRGRTRSICFPESHDTERLATEWGGDMNRIKQHYLFTALICSGVLAPIGFEYGFRKKPHVVHSNPLDYEGANYDMTEYIRQINALKKAHKVFQEDNEVRRIDSGHGEVLALRKTSNDGGESVVMLFNLTGNDQDLHLRTLKEQQNLKAPDGKESLRLHPWGAVILKVN